jgi:hypothetical protein
MAEQMVFIKQTITAKQTVLIKQTIIAKQTVPIKQTIIAKQTITAESKFKLSIFMGSSKKTYLAVFYYMDTDIVKPIATALIK